MKNTLKIALLSTVIFFGLSSLHFSENQKKSQKQKANHFISIHNDTDEKFFFCENGVYEIGMFVEPGATKVFSYPKEISFSFYDYENKCGKSFLTADKSTHKKVYKVSGFAK